MPCRLGCRAVWDTVPSGIRCRAVWDTVPSGLQCRAVWDTMSCRLGFAPPNMKSTSSPSGIVRITLWKLCFGKNFDSARKCHACREWEGNGAKWERAAVPPPPAAAPPPPPPINHRSPTPGHSAPPIPAASAAYLLTSALWLRAHCGPPRCRPKLIVWCTASAGCRRRGAQTRANAHTRTRTRTHTYKRTLIDTHT